MLEYCGRAASRLYAAIATAVAPRRRRTVSEWADNERVVSAKASAEPGRWRTERNPVLREPMDALSARSGVHEVTLKFCIQIGKTEVALNWLGYTFDHDPAPVMVCLPGEVSQSKWIAQKLSPMVDETPAVQRAMTSTASRDSANTRTFKDFAGGQLYIEHAGSPSRLKSTSVRKLIADELDEFAANLTTGDDPVAMLEGRFSAFPSTYQALWISSPQMAGASRIDEKWLASDQRRYHVPCPHCGHEQPLEWSGLHWGPGGTPVYYACRECGVAIDEHHKTAMIAAGRWIAGKPDAKHRGYHLNCLYYPFGLGPTWSTLVETWLKVQNDPAKLKTFVNDRLAETWEDPAMRAVKHNVIADRAEPYRLRVAPRGVLAITVGVDTQDNRLAVHIVGWGRSLQAWTIDYVELPGDPADPAVWTALTELLNRPIEHECGGTLRSSAVAIDMGGHRTEDVKHYVRQRLVTRPMCIFGAVQNNAVPLGKAKLVDVTYKGKTDRRGVAIYAVGTVNIKHRLYSRISTDAEKDAAMRMVRLSDELAPEFFAGLVSETYNPTRNRFEKRTGARNEPLDTWVYAYAAAHHPELRLHRRSATDWDAAEQRLIASKPGETQPVEASSQRSTATTTSPPPAERLGFVNGRRRGGWMKQ